MKIFVVGATGPLGIFICQEALRRGHSLHIYARNPSKLPKDVSGHADVNVRYHMTCRFQSHDL